MSNKRQVTMCYEVSFMEPFKEGASEEYIKDAYQLAVMINEGSGNDYLEKSDFADIDAQGRTANSWPFSDEVEFVCFYVTELWVTTTKPPYT